MILFCDTSALMKAYASEDHSEHVRRLLNESAQCLVSLITWAEMFAAFSMKQRTQQITGEQAAEGIARLKKEWGSFGKIAVDPTLVADAGDLAQRFGLRAYDSIQLASAQRTHRQLGRNLLFCCFDKQLNAAATALGIGVAPLG